VSGGRGRALAAAGGVLGGLLVVGGGAGTWLTFEGVREVGGARLVEATTVPGSELAPTVIAWGLGLVVVGLVLLALRGRAARVVAAVLGLLAVAAGVAVGLGLGLAGGIDGGVDGGSGTLGSGGA
jgi:hypothetical protein